MNSVNTLEVHSGSTFSERYKKYFVIFEAIARVIHLIGKLELALRGRREDIMNSSSKEDKL